MCVCVNGKRWWSLGYKELAHIITESGKARDLLFASWSPRKAGGGVAVK